MDVLDGCCECFCCPVPDGAEEDAVAVVVIGYEEVVVALAGGHGQSSGLVGVDKVFGFIDGEETRVGSGVVTGLDREGLVFFFWWSLWLGALLVLPLAVEVAHGCGL